MKYLLQAESIVPFIIAVFLIHQLPVHFAWWVWILLFLAPDLSAMGYLVNKPVGAVGYNLFHHQLTAVVVAAAGWMTQALPLELTGLILLGHSSLDRLMGYGLKYGKGFKYTHLGTMGHSATATNK